jgi:Mor family transcriptional regulator
MNEKDFLAIQKEWAKRLRESGFNDIEDFKGRLKSPDKRTIAFQNQERIREFHIQLADYLATFAVPELHKQILEMYTQGEYAVRIAKKLNYSERWIRKIIKRYQKEITGF